ALFFQAEDGIRDDLVTGVQTCALPISVIQRYMNHAGYRVVEGPLSVPGQENQRSFRVELQRANGCNVVLPIDLVRAKSGTWLVLDVHLDIAGNPAAGCKP